MLRKGSPGLAGPRAARDEGGGSRRPAVSRLSSALLAQFSSAWSHLGAHPPWLIPVGTPLHGTGLCASSLGTDGWMDGWGTSCSTAQPHKEQLCSERSPLVLHEGTTSPSPPGPPQDTQTGASTMKNLIPALLLCLTPLSELSPSHSTGCRYREPWV